jgi:hypothetical protein
MTMMMNVCPTCRKRVRKKYHRVPSFNMQLKSVIFLFSMKAQEFRPSSPMWSFTTTVNSGVAAFQPRKYYPPIDPSSSRNMFEVGRHNGEQLMRIHSRFLPPMHEKQFPSEFDSSIDSEFFDEINGQNDNFSNATSESVMVDGELVDGDDVRSSSYMATSCVVNLDDISQPYMSRLDSESTFVEFTDDGLCVPAGPLGQLKEEVANYLVEPSVEIVIASAVLLNSLLVALSTIDQLDPYMPAIRMAENVVAIIFIIDFLGRWFSSSRDLGRFVFDGRFLVDVLVVILPFMVSVTPAYFWDQADILPSALTRPSGLFNLQLLRVLRLRRFLQDLDTFEKFCDRLLGRVLTRRIVVQEWQLQLSRVLLSLFTLLSVASGLIYTAENEVQDSTVLDYSIDFGVSEIPSNFMTVSPHFFFVLSGQPKYQQLL